MGKYTVQLRFVVEQLIRDAGGSGVLMEDWHLAYPKLGLAPSGNLMGLQAYPVLTEDYRERLNRKIIQRYWFDEIGQETVGQFSFMLNETMNRIMPYYNQLYAAKIENAREFLGESWGVDRTTELLRKTTGTDTGTVDGRNTTSTDDVNRMLDTPQARIQNLDDGYLTSASKGNSNTSATSAVSDSRTSTANLDDSGTYTESGHRISPEHWNLIVGIGRELLNIDNMVVNDMELRDSFMHIW